MTAAAPMTSTCIWCSEPFEPRRDGGSKQRFCSTAHRRAFESAARAYVRRAIEEGTLTVAELRNAPGTARALVGGPADRDQARSDPSYASA